jgi:hypothetical protein
MDEMKSLTSIQTDLGKAKDIAFTMIFATKQKEVDQFADRIAKQCIEDAVIWMVYPKGTSKNTPANSTVTMAGSDLAKII